MQQYTVVTPFHFFLAMSGTPRGLILFGSQTGTSEEIAKQIYQRGKTEKSLDLHVAAMDTYATKISVLTKPSVIVFVLSSTGEGDPPENAVKFFGKLKRLLREQKAAAGQPTKFTECKFTILGLGDSNYSIFQGAPRALYKSVSTFGLL
jgi:methionine synthase reductase